VSSDDRSLIRRVRINPRDLDWRRFTIAVDGSEKMIGCGQIKFHADGLAVLASIAVEPQYRGRGVARAIIDSLLAGGPRPLYLTCRSTLGSFYAKWGFSEVTRGEMPPYYRRLAGIVSALAPIFARGDHLLVMRLQ
jgi:N-acetylglutamate synthase-like GNAT family acetyltransferase